MNYKVVEWTDEKVKRFWDYESQFPENYFTFQVGHVVISKLKKFFPKAKTVLDYGCGPGFLIPHLMKENLRVTALEFSNESLQNVKNKFGGQPLFEGAFSLEEIISSGKKYDVIFILEVVEHINDYYLNETFKNVHKFLNDQGVAIITTPNDEDLSKMQICCPECNTVFHRWQHVRNWNRNTLSAAVTNGGFKIIEMIEINFSEKPESKKIKWIKKIKKIFTASNSTYKIKQPNLVCVFGKQTY